MKHLMSPLDFSTEELENLFSLAGDIEKNPASMPTHATGKFSQPASMSQAQEQGSALNPP